MSIEVELPKLLEVAGGFGTIPMLLSTDADGRPRAAATSLSWQGTTATARAGRRSLANAGERRLVSLLWPAPPGERFALLVDGEATQVTPDDDPGKGGFVTIEVARAILHVVGGVHT
ncbi:MAG: hypothetical protein IPJ14_13560 [Kineosporiaceae bacterium]|nr:hypothetical protein [Kineosporiaceae bacterium]MBK8077995.1 hypothetical protein [Kineosporiaceae bacterium]